MRCVEALLNQAPARARTQKMGANSVVERAVRSSGDGKMGNPRLEITRYCNSFVYHDLPIIVLGLLMNPTIAWQSVGMSPVSC